MRSGVMMVSGSVGALVDVTAALDVVRLPAESLPVALRFGSVSLDDPGSSKELGAAAAGLTHQSLRIRGDEARGLPMGQDRLGVDQGTDGS
jgi:hypothetical protein